LQIVVYIHSGFFEIGFVLHNLVKMIAVFSALTTDYTDERAFGECVYVISHLPIFSSTRKPLAYLFDTYYTEKRPKKKQNLFSILDS
jgi:hypothetical protein